MRLRQIAQTVTATAVAMIAFGSAPAFAHEGPHGHGAYPGAPPYADGRADARPEWRGHHGGAPQHPGYDYQARDAWLADCRSRVSRRDNGVGGAVIGGLVGGVAGNRIAGRGNRTAGTIAGAAVGAVAGAVIDKAEDRGQSRDECEAYLDNYYASYSHGYGAGYSGYGYGYQGYAVPMMMVPVHFQRSEPECTETVEYVYEDVPVRPRPRARPMTKRVKVVPDKRVKVVPVK